MNLLCLSFQLTTRMPAPRMTRVGLAVQFKHSDKKHNDRKPRVDREVVFSYLW